MERLARLAGTADATETMKTTETAQNPPSRLHAIAEAYALASTGSCERAASVLAASHRPWATDEPESLFVHEGSAVMAEALVHHAAGRMPAAAAGMTRALHHAVEDNLAQAQASYSWQLGRIPVSYQHLTLPTI